MTRFVLVPGAGGAGWYWHRALPLLSAAGHDAVAVELPGADPDAGLPEYTRLVLDAVDAGEVADTVLVAQSLGGFTATMAAAARNVRELVHVNAMIPLPGETPGEWGSATGSAQARAGAAERGGYPAEYTDEIYLAHDVTAETWADLLAHEGDEAMTVFASPCDLTALTTVPTRVVAGADDRLFPADFQRAVARERLGVEADVLPGGHLIALSRPAELAEYLTRGR